MLAEIKRALSQPDLLVSNKQWREWCAWLVGQIDGETGEAKKVEIVK